MFLTFDNIDILINNSGILCTKATFNNTNNIVPFYTLGNKRATNILPTAGIKTDFSCEYVPVISQEPNFSILQNILDRTNNSNYYGEKINFGGLHGDNWFLNNYSLNIQPNNIVLANVAYSTYWDLCGELQPKNNSTDYLSLGDLAHAWKTKISTTGDNNTVYNFSYNCQINWIPVNTIGRKVPVEMVIDTIEESINFTLDTYNSVLFTGQNVFNNIIYDNQNIEINNLSLLCHSSSIDDCNNSLNINLDGFKIKSATISAETNEIIRTNYTAYRYK